MNYTCLGIKELRSANPLKEDLDNVRKCCDSNEDEA